MNKIVTAFLISWAVFGQGFAQLTAYSPQLVADLNPETSNSGPKGLTVFGNHLMFAARTKIPSTDEDGNAILRSKTGLWAFDGEGEPDLIFDLKSRSWFDPQIIGDKLYFARGTGRLHPAELWSLDTDLNFERIAAYVSKQHELKIGKLVQFGDELLFSVGGRNLPAQIFRYSDGMARPQKIAEIVEEVGRSVFHYSIAFNNRLYFTADDGVHGTEFWVYDGTPTVRLVEDIDGEDNFLGPYDLSVFGDKLYFSYDHPQQWLKLWTMDAEENIEIATDDWDLPNLTAPHDMVVFDDQMFFGARYGKESSARNLVHILDENGDLTILSQRYVGPLVQHNGNMYFGAVEIGRDRELWRLNSDRSTTLIGSPGPIDSLDDDVFSLDGNLFFVSEEGDTNNELYVSDGINPPVALPEINPSVGEDLLDGSSRAGEFTKFKDAVYFYAFNEEIGGALWRVQSIEQ